MGEQMRLDEILGGSDPDGRPKDPVERQQEQRNAEAKVTPPDGTPTDAAPADAKAEAKPERNTSRKKQWQQKERDTREAAEGRVRDPETGQYVKKADAAAAESAATDATTATAKADTKSDAKPDAAATVATAAATTDAAAAQQPAEQRQEFTAKELAFLKAAQEERRKRQAMEQELAALRQNATPQEKKTFWDDPEAALQQFQQQITHATLKTKLDTSESIARTRHKDFDENVAEFASLMETVPGVRDQWLAAADPAEFAYQVGKRQRDLKQIGDIEEYRAKIERDMRARLEAEFKAKSEERARQAAELTPSLSDARGGGAQARPVFTGPTSLDNILGG